MASKPKTLTVLKTRSGVFLETVLSPDERYLVYQNTKNRYHFNREPDGRILSLDFPLPKQALRIAGTLLDFRLFTGQPYTNDRRCVEKVADAPLVELLNKINWTHGRGDVRYAWWTETEKREQWGVAAIRIPLTQRTGYFVFRSFSVFKTGNWFSVRFCGRQRKCGSLCSHTAIKLGSLQ